MGDEAMDLEEFRKMLLAARSELMGDSRRMREDADSDGGEAGRSSIHMAEAASDTHEQHLMFDRLSASSETLQEIDDALARIDAGTYGQCEECGAPIPPRRLRIKPYASMCVECRRKEEQS